MKWDGIRYFARSEFVCSCCGKEDMDYDFVEVMDRLRETLGRRLIVTSGWRCKRYNKKVGGKQNSAHLLGIAADITVVGSQRRFNIIDYGISLGITRFGIGKNYMHIDIGDDTTGHPKRVIWTYYS